MAKKVNNAPETELKKNGGTAKKLADKAKKPADSKRPTMEDLEAYKADIAALITKYDEHAKFNESARMTKIAEKAKEIVGKYNADAEAIAFAAIRRAQNPMVELVTKKSFSGIAVREVKDKETKLLKLTMIDTEITLDPLRLHNRVKGGIGASPSWPRMVGRLWDNLVAISMMRCGMDPKKIRDSLYVGKAESFIKLKAEDDTFSTEMAKACTQEVFDAMLGAGYEVRDDILGKIMEEIGQLPRNVANHGAISPNTIRKVMVGAMNLTVLNLPVEAQVKSRKR